MDALLNVDAIPSGSIVEHVIIGLDMYPHNDVVIDLPEAIVHHFPDFAEPTHVIVWTNGATMVFNYHQINYISKPDGYVDR